MAPQTTWETDWRIIPVSLSSSLQVKTQQRQMGIKTHPLLVQLKPGNTVAVEARLTAFDKNGGYHASLLELNLHQRIRSE